MEISGIVENIFDIQVFGASFKKRSLLLMTDERYPQKILIDFIQDNVNLLDSIRVGDRVRISFNIKGREWKNSSGVIRHFNSIQGWRIEKLNFFKKNSESTMELKDKDDDDENLSDDIPF